MDNGMWLRSRTYLSPLLDEQTIVKCAVHIVQSTVYIA